MCTVHPEDGRVLSTACKPSCDAKDAGSLRSKASHVGLYGLHVDVQSFRSVCLFHFLHVDVVSKATFVCSILLLGFEVFPVSCLAVWPSGWLLAFQESREQKMARFRCDNRSSKAHSFMLEFMLGNVTPKIRSWSVPGRQLAQGSRESQFEHPTISQVSS